jgi:cytochrome c-type biogenesis protein CcmH
MILWIILTVLTSLAVVGVTIPLMRRHDLNGVRDTNVAILKAQLSEIGSQHAAGAVSGLEAEGMRTEIKRRILAESLSNEPNARPMDRRALPWVAVALAGVIALAATGLYAAIGRPDLTAGRAVQPDHASEGGATHPVADVSTMVARLEEHLQQSPNDAEGWRMLGWSYRSVGRSTDAAKAYARAAALDPKNAEYRSAEGDALVDAAGGQVTDDALAAFQTAVKIDPADPRARYFLALYEDQQGRHDEAMIAWIALLKSAPAGAPWADEVRDFVVRIAQERHIDVSGRLPLQTSGVPLPASSAPAAELGATPGPTQEQVDAADQMSSEDRARMIRGMVDRLTGELKVNPRSAAGWIQLMRAHVVLGDMPSATANYRDAQHALADSPSEQAELRNAAKSLGISGG